MDQSRERMKKLGQSLKARREQLNLTQNDLARAVGYDQSQIISNIERGVAKIPVAKIAEFSRVLQLPEEKLQLELVALDLTPQLASRLPLIQSAGLGQLFQKYKEADAKTQELFVSAVNHLFGLDSKLFQTDLDAITPLQSAS